MTKSFMRLDVVYYDIAEEQLRLYSRAESELKKYKEQSGKEWLLQIPKLLELTDRCRQASVIGITFAAMCLEAFFFNYSSDHLGHGMAEALDKLDLPSKLIIAPRLVLGKDKGIEKSAHVFELVQDLTKDRNLLVHFKSKSFEAQELRARIAFTEKLLAQFAKGLRNGVSAVEETLKALDDLHGTPGKYFNNVIGRPDSKVPLT